MAFSTTRAGLGVEDRKHSKNSTIKTVVIWQTFLEYLLVTFFFNF